MVNKIIKLGTNKFKKINVNDVKKGDIVSWTVNRLIGWSSVEQIVKSKAAAEKEGNYTPFGIRKGQKTAVVHNPHILGNLSFVPYSKIKYAWRPVK